MSDSAVDLVQRAFLLAASLSLPVLLAAVLASLLTSVFQAVTTWSDAALAHVPRLLAVGLALSLSAPWIAHEMTDFARLVWSP